MKKFDSFTVTRDNGTFIAMLFSSFLRLEAQENAACTVLGSQSMLCRMGVGQDHWMSAALFLSAEIDMALEELIDFDAWVDKVGGVFAYEHLDFIESAGRFKRGSETSPREDGCRSLPVFLFNRMFDHRWQDMTNHWLPAGDWLRAKVKEWAVREGVPLLDYRQSDAKLSPTELMHKYGVDGEHPDFTNIRWLTACSTRETRAAYWDWVSEQTRKADGPDDEAITFQEVTAE